MSPAHTVSKLIRIAMAAAFAFMSLGHSPIMTLAHAGADTGRASAHHAMDRATAPTDLHSHHGTSHSAAGPNELAEQTLDFDGPDVRRPVPVCHAYGCLAAIGPPAVQPPATSSLLLGRLGASPPRALHSANPEPADPPPRLPV
jgi:hypothetical protein